MKSYSGYNQGIFGWCDLRARCEFWMVQMLMLLGASLNFDSKNAEQLINVKEDILDILHVLLKTKSN
jgi:hypothetical protein